jgi:hypothetical protein
MVQSSQRCLAFTDVFNFRDLGGYPAAGGRTVRWRRLYRADDLSRLQPVDYPGFEALGLRTVVDLRRPAEVDQDGRVSVPEGVNYYHVGLDYPHWPAQEFADTQERIAYLRLRYVELATYAAADLAAVLKLIADPSSAPLVFHCVAGKDRTGVVAALTLALLGVDTATIADDYALSEAAEPAAWEYYRRRAGERVPRQRWRTFTVSPREGIINLLDELTSKYGSVPGYAAAIGIDAAQIESMRTHLLTGA